MIDSLLKYYPDVASRYKRRVLIPGAGLARLGWEIAHLGERQSDMVGRTHPI